ncbi:MAG TPA: [LysW]-lysine hydrolase [Anaerolineales bacterium]|jgi:LysW-gamma-L-lysine carboxypeptidase|nr:[LysW]-lysine hydrolase [Anaerolineales bacterium]
MMEPDFETLIGLVSHYSPSGQEHNAVEWLVRRMNSIGYDNARIDEAGNAVGIIGDGPKQVVLLGHIDTVPGEIMVRRIVNPPINDRRDAIPHYDVLYGRGTVDAKGPLACFVDAAARVGIREGWQFVVIGAVEEERDSEGARFVAEQYKPDFAVIGEPSQWDRITLGYKGSAWSNVTVRRSQAHSASGEQTASEAAVESWLAIKAYVESFNAGKRNTFDKLLLTLRGMESGSEDFEQWARLHVGVRLPVDVSPKDWYSILKEIAHQAAVEGAGFAIPAWACEKNTLLVRTFLKAIRSLGGEPRFVHKTGTADLNIVAPVWNCPAVVYGPGDSALDHTPEEHIPLGEYANAVSILSHVLCNLSEGTPA